MTTTRATSCDAVTSKDIARIFQRHQSTAEFTDSFCTNSDDEEASVFASSRGVTTNNKCRSSAGHQVKDGREEEKGQSKTKNDQEKSSSTTKLKQLRNAFEQGTEWRLSTLSVILAAFVTFSYANSTNNNHNISNNQVHVQIAIMTVLVLCGAVAPQWITAAGCGAFVGGHRILDYPRDLGWLFALALVVGLLWSLVMTSRYQILNGFGGRLGTTTFIGMNLTMILLLGPTGTVPWNLYFDWNKDPHDERPWRQHDSARDDIERCLVFVLAVVWLSVVGSAARFYPISTTQPVNTVLVPATWALGSMLVINATQYRHAGTLFDGFAVGSYVAMASFDKLPTVLAFAVAGLLASLWGLFWAPFFVGFAGKAGFTSICGHVTYFLFQQLFRSCSRWLRRERQEDEQELCKTMEYQGNMVLMESPEMIVEEFNV